MNYPESTTELDVCAGKCNRESQDEQAYWACIAECEAKQVALATDTEPDGGETEIWRGYFGSEDVALPVPYYQDESCTIYHGDCRELLPLIAPSSVDLVLTDPPYGVDFDTDFTRFTGGVAAATGSHAAVHGDAQPFDPALLSGYKRRILFGANCYSDALGRGSWIVWDKRSPGGSKNVMSDGEVAWYSEGHGVYIWSHTWDGFNRASERGTAFHPTQKPVALMRWILGRWSKPAEMIFDPFMGSGPIAAACRDLGRRYLGIEIEERYCEIAARRLSQSVLPLEIPA